MSSDELHQTTLRHQVPACATQTATELGLWGDRRDWHCCECGWPGEPCRQTWPQLRDLLKTRASSPRCGDSALPYLMVLPR